MAATYDTTTANSRLTVVRDAVDTGTLVIGTSALAGGSTGTLATFSLDAVSGTVTNKVLTFSSLPKSAVASAGGTAVKGELRASGGGVICSGLSVGVTGSGADVIVDTASVVNGRTVNLLTATITHP